MLAFTAEALGLERGTALQGLWRDATFWLRSVSKILPLAQHCSVLNERLRSVVEAQSYACHITRMQQKTDGRVVRLLTKHLAVEDALEQWFLVAVGDDEKAKEAVLKATNGTDEVVEIVGHIPATTLADWGMTEGDIRLVLPGEPISS